VVERSIKEFGQRQPVAAVPGDLERMDGIPKYKSTVVHRIVMNLAGTIVPMATPVDESGNGRDRRVDTRTLERFTRSLVEAGVHGLFPGSSVGEFPSLTPEQNRTVVRTVAATAEEDTTVIAGCCDTGVDRVLANVDAARRAGADAAVVVTPYYLETTQRGIRDFFETVADGADLPLLLYNIPGLTGNRLAVETVERLAEREQIVGLKDTSGDLAYQYEAVTVTPDDFLVFQGATGAANASLNLGVDGLIAGPANVFPRAMAELYEAHGRRDTATVDRLTREVVLPVVSATSGVPTAAAIKYLVGLGGIDLGGPVTPLASLTDRQRDRLKACHRSVTEFVEKTVPSS